MFEFLTHLLDTADFSPRWNCGTWTAGHGWLHIASDGAIFAAYAAIPAVLVFFVLRRRELPFLPIFWLFAGFILFCGTNHLIEASLFWHPWYRLSGVVKLGTALLSWATVIALVRIVPAALELPRRAKASTELERQVQERTKDYREANAHLEQEVAERRRVEGDRDRFFALALDLFCVAGFDGYFKRVNQAFAHTLGYTAAELLCSPFFDFVHPEDVKSMRGEVEKLAGGGVTVDFENRYRAKDGTYHWIQWNATASPDQGVIYAVGRDITDRKRVERQMREFNETLERRVAERTAALEQQSRELRALIDALSRSNQELDDFAYIASHDLKEPMRGIANYAAFLAEDYSEKLDDAGRAKLATLQRLCGRMTDLLDVLLQFSRLGRTDLAVGPTDLDAIVGQVLDSLQFLIEERGVKLDRPAPLPVVRCDRARIGEVFRNLITNAIKYNDKEQRRIWIGATIPDRPGSPIIFHVRDNGIGIREKHLRSSASSSGCTGATSSAAAPGPA
jgi:PAS domain S-box-containing protein